MDQGHYAGGPVQAPDVRLERGGSDLEARLREGTGKGEAGQGADAREKGDIRLH